LSCSCPDWADMCKHVAAALYGVGARLDQRPQLLFELRGVDENELLANAGQDLALTGAAPGAAKILDNSDVAALFGLEMAEFATPDAVLTGPKRQLRSDASRASKTQVVKQAAVKTKRSLPRATRTKSGGKKTRSAGTTKKGARPRHSA
jgi:uncharacterized Zn finger protein